MSLVCASFKGPLSAREKRMGVLGDYGPQEGLSVGGQVTFSAPT